MLITLTTGYTYDLSDDSAVKKLKSNLSTMQSRNQRDRLEHVYRQVQQYEYNQGPAGEICRNVQCRLNEMRQKKNSGNRRQMAPALPAPMPLSSVLPPAQSFALPSGNRGQMDPIASPSIPPTVWSYGHLSGNGGQMTQAFQMVALPAQGYLTYSSNEEHIISMAPLNSSGDIYHILALLMLLKEFKKKIPQVKLAYDIDGKDSPTSSSITVGNQVKRSKDFSDTLGFGEYFELVNIPFRGYRQKVRQCALEDYLQESAKKRQKNICYIDQMATTVFISDYFESHGYEKITTILYKYFSQRDSKYFSTDMQESIDKYVSDNIQLIEVNSNNQPVVLMHIRYSSKANKQLNLPDNYIVQLRNFFRGKGYYVCFLLADSRRKKSYLDDNGTTVVIAPFKEKIFFLKEEGKDYSKQAHLQVLLALKKHFNVLRVVGNTSGTLDLAAFIGLHTYNIHQFQGVELSSTHQIQKVTSSYQECRLHFQVRFLSVAFLLVYESEEKHVFYLINGNNAGLDEWLNFPSPGIGLEFFCFSIGQDKLSLAQKSEKSKEKFGYKNMFYATLFSTSDRERKIPIDKITFPDENITKPECFSPCTTEQLRDKSHAANSILATGIFGRVAQPPVIISLNVEGLQFQPVKGDGHCLYAAVSYYLDTDVSELRRQVAQTIKANIKTYRDIITGLEPNKTVEQYLYALEHTNEWADNLEIAVLMQVFDRPIVIVDSPDGHIRNTSEYQRYQNKEPIFVYYNGHNHYDALILNSTVDSGQALLSRLTARQGEFKSHSSTVRQKHDTDDPVATEPLIEITKHEEEVRESTELSQLDIKKKYGLACEQAQSIQQTDISLTIGDSDENNSEGISRVVGR